VVAINIYATRTALSEWAAQSFTNKPNGVSFEPRLESFGSNTRLAIEVQRFGSYLTTIYAYGTAAARDADTGRDINVGSIVYSETSGPLAFWSGSAWTVDAFAVKTAMRAALAAFASSLVIASGVPVPGPPGTTDFDDLTDKPTTLAGYGVDLGAQPIVANGNETTVQRKIDQIPISPRDFNASAGTGGDDTAAVQAALDKAGMEGGAVSGEGGPWSVSHISIAAGSAFFEMCGNWELIANSDTAQTSLVEIKRGNFSITGSVAAVNNYRTNYAYGFWIWHESQLQAVAFDKLIAAGCLVGGKIGNEAYPAAIISENTLESFRTYGCPEALHVVGIQTYGLINNPPAMSADAFGGDSAWQALKKRAFVNVGSNSVITGGEVLQVTSSAPTDYVFEMRPLVAGGELSWGRLKIQGSYIETAGPLCLIDNPSGLTGANTSKDRGRFVCSLVDGFVAGDAGPFIKVADDSGFTGDIIVELPNFWFPGVRSSPNIDCGNNACHVILRSENFGGGFLPPLAGVVGGILHFDRQVILQAYDLPAVSLAAGVLKFQSTVAGGNLARWNSLYSPSTGGFTVPLGGFKEIRIVASLNATGVTGNLVVKKNGSVVKPRPVTADVFDIEYTELDPTAGSVFTVELAISSGSGLPTTNAGPNTLIIEASR
jgi:hypothetical protein